jgi:hypothetical protein
MTILHNVTFERLQWLTCLADALLAVHLGGDGGRGATHQLVAAVCTALNKRRTIRMYTINDHNAMCAYYCSQWNNASAASKVASLQQTRPYSKFTTAGTELTALTAIACHGV